MRPLLYVLSFLAVMGLGFWAYRENYTTQATLRNVTALQDEIAGLREALAIQRDEWAYLNRPERLRELVMLNFDRLGLLPMEPHQLSYAATVGYPLPPTVADTFGTLGIVAPVDVSGIQNADPEVQTP